MTTPSAGGPLPLKPGESPEEFLKETATRLLIVLTGGRAAGPELPVIVAYLKAYGDRRGEEERAKHEESEREWCKRRDDAIGAYLRALEEKDAVIDRLKAAVAEERAKALAEMADRVEQARDDGASMARSNLNAARTEADGLRASVSALEGLLSEGRLWVVTGIQPTDSAAREQFLRLRRSLLDRMDAALATAPSGDAKGTRDG